MGLVSIVLNGRTYRLSCGDGEEERLAALAAYVKEKFDGLASEVGAAVVNEQVLLMTALMVADDLFEALGEPNTAANSTRDGNHSDSLG